MESKDLYGTAHLVVAAVRVIGHQKNTAPSVDEVCGLLSFSGEHGLFVCKKLGEIGIIEIVEGGYGVRLFVRDHLKIEDIPRAEKEQPSLRDEVEKFQNSRKGFKDQIESFQVAKAKRQKNLFARIEDKLKSEIKSDADGGGKD